YRLADHLGLRMGQVKHPFGIYTEVFSVGTLRPFLDLPQGVYGPVGFAGQSYKGIGLTGVAGGGAWSLDYDVYGGGNDLQKFAVPEAFLHGDSLQRASSEIELQSTRNVIGGRLVLHTPVQGLSVGASSYTGILNEPAANRVTVAAAQLEYRSNRFTFETELAHENQAGDEYATGYYAQAAYRLSPEWQLAGQYDYLKNTFVGVSSAAAPSLQYHKEGALALSRWFSRSLVLRAEYHRISGNRFAMPHPEDLLGAVNAGTLRTTTDLVQVGGQFSF
ncbi:MAG: porin, partial [Gemmatimonadota bacterium]